MRWFRSPTRIVPQPNADAFQRPPLRPNTAKAASGRALRNHLTSLFSFRSAWIACFALSGLATSANAAVTINSITGVSRVEGLVLESGSTTTSTTITAYGGIAGAFTCSDNTLTCNNCADPGLSGDDNLVACNDARIGPQVVITITLISDTASLPTTARTAISTDDTGGTLISGVTQVAVTQGTQVSMQVPWSAICSTIGAGTNCEITESVSKVLRVGIDVDGDGSLNDAIDEVKQISFNLVNIPNAATAPYKSLGPINCQDTGAQAGLCQYSVFPGDEKFYVENLQGLDNGFPNSPTVEFRQVRVFYTTDGFASINPTTNYADLRVEGSGTSTEVSPNQVSGGIENEQNYFTKIALVDAAGNVGYYTPQLADDYCDGISYTNCHQVQPGKVVGVLSKDFNCFIATAAYGSKLAPQVETFRRFRDRFLLPTNLGASFVDFYYEHSPKYAKMISESETLRAASRVALWPLLVYAWLSLKVGFETALLLCATFALLPFFALRAMKSTKASRGSERA